MLVVTDVINDMLAYQPVVQGVPSSTTYSTLAQQAGMPTCH